MGRKVRELSVSEKRTEAAAATELSYFLMGAFDPEPEEEKPADPEPISRRPHLEAFCAGGDREVLSPESTGSNSISHVRILPGGQDHYPGSAAFSRFY